MTDQAPKSISFQIFGVDFDTSITFTGKVETPGGTGGDTVTYVGAATLGAPFPSTTIDQLTVGLTNTKKQVNTKVSFPLLSPITSIIEDSVEPKVGDAWTVIDAIFMPVIRLWGAPDIIIANFDGVSDHAGLPYNPGFNCYSLTVLNAFEPFSSLDKLFPSLGLSGKDITLYLGCDDKNYSLGGTLVLDAELDSACTLNTLGIAFHQDTASSTLGAKATFTLKLSGDVLELEGGVQGTVGEDASLVIWGYISPKDGGKWVDPFGLKGLTITGMGAQIGVTETAPFISLGIRGEIHLGGVLDGDIAVLLSTSDPVLVVTSEDGLSLSQLIKAVTTIDTEGVLDVSLKELEIYAVIDPGGTRIAGKFYAPGYAFGGTLDLWGYQATVEASLSYSKGGSFQGNFDPIKLDGFGVTFVQITSADGTGNLEVELGIQNTGVSNKINGRISLVDGTVVESIDQSLKVDSFDYKVSADHGSIYASAEVSCQDGTFTVNASENISVSTGYQGLPLKMTVKSSFLFSAGKKGVDQEISFAFSLMGKSIHIGPFPWSQAFKEISDLVKAYEKLSSGQFNAALGKVLILATDEAFSWTKANITTAYGEASDLFKAAGAPHGKIADGLVSVYKATPEQAVTAVTDTPLKAATMLRTTFNYSIDQTGEYLNDTDKMSESAISTTLKGAGYGADTVNDWMKSSFPYLS